MTPERGAAEAEAVIQRAERFVNVDDVWHEDPRSLVAALLSELRDLREQVQTWEANRQRVRDSFGHRDAVGKCQCVYCRQDAEGLTEHAADYEMRLFSTENRLESAERDVTALRTQLAAAQAREQALRELEQTWRKQVQRFRNGAQEYGRHLPKSAETSHIIADARERDANELAAVLKEGQ